MYNDKYIIIHNNRYINTVYLLYKIYKFYIMNYYKITKYIHYITL